MKKMFSVLLLLLIGICCCVCSRIENTRYTENIVYASQKTALEIQNVEVIELDEGVTNSPSFISSTEEVINVRDFGAVGDGETDDTEAIQNALDAVLKQDCNTVYFPTGVYMITNVSIHSDTILKGTGEGSSTIKRNKSYTTDGFGKYDRSAPMLSTYTVDAQEIKNICFYNLTIDGNVESLDIQNGETLQTLTATNIWLYRVSNCEITNCSIINSVASGITIQGSDNVLIENNNIRNCGIKTLDDFSLSRNGISINGMYYDDKEQTNVEKLSRSIKIRNNTIEMVRQEGIMFSFVEDIIIEGNCISDCGDRGIEGDSFFKDSEKCLINISDNIIKNCTLYGITMGNTPKSASVIICNNIIDKVGQCKVLSLTLGDASYVNVSNNIFTNIGSDNEQPGMYIEARHLIFSENMVSLNVAATILTVKCESAMVLNNTFEGINNVQGIASICDCHLTISGNYFYNINKIVMLNVDASFVDVSDNIVVDAIYLVGVSSNIQYLKVHGNYLEVGRENRTQNVVRIEYGYRINTLLFEENYNENIIYDEINKLDAIKKIF